MSYSLEELQKLKRTESACLEKLPLCAYEEKDIDLLYELATSQEFIKNQVKHDEGYDLACQTLKYAILLHGEKIQDAKLLELLRTYQPLAAKYYQYDIAQWLCDEKLDKLLLRLHSYTDQKLFKTVLYLVLLEEDKERIKKILKVYRERKKFNLQFIDFRIITWWIKHVCEKVAANDLVYILKTYDNESRGRDYITLVKILLEKRKPKQAHDVMSKFVDEPYGYQDIMLQIQNALHKGIYKAEPESSISFSKPVAPDITSELQNNDIDSILQRFTFEERSRILRRLAWDTPDKALHFLEKALENALQISNAEYKYGQLHLTVLSALHANNFEFAQIIASHFQKDYDRNEAMRAIATKYFLQGNIEQGLSLWRDPIHLYEYVMLYDDFSTYPNSKEMLLAFLKRLLSKEKQQIDINESIAKILFHKGKFTRVLKIADHIKDAKFKCEMLSQMVKTVAPHTTEFAMALDKISTACKTLNRFDILMIETNLCNFLMQIDQNRAQQLFISLCQKLPSTDIETFIKVKYSGEFFDIFAKIFDIAHRLSKLDFLEQTIRDREDILSMFKECRVIEILEQETMKAQEKTFLLAYAATQQWYNDRFKLLFAPILNALYGPKAFSLLMECVKSEKKMRSSSYEKYLDYIHPQKPEIRMIRASNYKNYLDYAPQCIYPNMNLEDIKYFIQFQWGSIRLGELAVNLLNCGHSIDFVKSAFACLPSTEYSSDFGHSKIMQSLERIQQSKKNSEEETSCKKNIYRKFFSQCKFDSTNYGIIRNMLKIGNYREAIDFAQGCSEPSGTLHIIFSTILKIKEKREYTARIKKLRCNPNVNVVEISTSEQIDLCNEFFDRYPYEPILLCLARNDHWTKIESLIDSDSHTELKSETFSKLAIIAAQQKRQVFKYLNKITEQGVLEQTIEDCSIHFAKNNLCSAFTGFLQQHISQLNNREKILQKWIESIALHSQNACYDIKEVLPLIDTHPDIIFLVNSILGCGIDSL